MQRVSPSPKPSPPSKTPKFFGVFENEFIFRLWAGIYNAAAPLITRVALITHNRAPALPGGAFFMIAFGRSIHAALVRQFMRNARFTRAERANHYLSAAFAKKSGAESKSFL